MNVIGARAGGFGDDVGFVNENRHLSIARSMGIDAEELRIAAMRTPGARLETFVSAVWTLH